MNGSRMQALAVMAGLVLGAISTGTTQMVNPSIDRMGEPFSYFSRSTDEIVAPDASAGTEITPEGFLYTGSGELMFLLGPEKVPIAARIRTLDDGYLPVVSYDQSDNGLVYRFTVFAAPVEGVPVNFIRIAISNPQSSRRTALLTTAVRYQSEQTTSPRVADNRFVRPATAERIGDYQQPGETFRSDWVYSFGNDVFSRDGRALYLFPANPAPELGMTLRGHYNRNLPLTPQTLEVTPQTPVGRVTYTLDLAPGQ